MCNSAKDLTQAIREGSVTITDAAQTCFDRIERYNPTINAVVTLNKEAALNAAKAADAHLKQGGDIPPLFGVPITIKDAFKTQGIRTTSSHPPLKDYIPTTDATVVTRLKNAGAIILGKTNLPELAGDIQCWSPLFGRTNNPWNPSLTSGGSSGGSAAAVAMNFSYLALAAILLAQFAFRRPIVVWQASKRPKTVCLVQAIFHIFLTLNALSGTCCLSAYWLGAWMTCAWDLAVLRELIALILKCLLYQ
jgi:hypothetical protein